jgi:hypothetical protein
MLDITEYLTLSQAAQALGYANTSYLRLKCIEMQIPGATKLGHNWLIPRQWVLSKQDKSPTGQGARGQKRK